MHIPSKINKFKKSNDRVFPIFVKVNRQWETISRLYLQFYENKLSYLHGTVVRVSPSLMARKFSFSHVTSITVQDCCQIIAFIPWYSKLNTISIGSLFVSWPIFGHQWQVYGYNYRSYGEFGSQEDNGFYRCCLKWSNMVDSISKLSLWWFRQCRAIDQLLNTR